MFLSIFTIKKYVVKSEKILVFLLDTPLIENNTKFENYCFSTQNENYSSVCTNNCGFESCSHSKLMQKEILENINSNNLESYNLGIYSQNIEKEDFGIQRIDYLNAMKFVLSKIENSSNKSIVNISWNTNKLFESDCSNQDKEFTDLVSNIIKNNGTVVTSVGNNGVKNQIAFPSCVRGVIPVSSGYSNNIEDYANYSTNFDIKIVDGKSRFEEFYPNYGTSISASKYTNQLIRNLQ